MPSVFLLRRSAQSIAKSCAALLGTAGWALAGTSVRASECLPALHQARPTVLACDLRMSDGHVDRLLHRLRIEGQAPKVLLFTPSADDPLLFPTLANGAHGYWVEPEKPAAALPAALAAAQADRARMSPQIARDTLAAFDLSRGSASCLHKPSIAHDLSPVSAQGEMQRSEQALLSLLAHGLLASEIALSWQLAVDEIEGRIAAIYRKLHLLKAASAIDLQLS
ncbi:hypothetical protein [Roseateles sp.]|uniref:hypothetical protein n=1 Tax=Roseateles sp. TaxID=1971397 RepID=UPI003BA75FAC